MEFTKQEILELRREVINECLGCGRKYSDHPEGEEFAMFFCEAYLYPKEKWRLGICNLATHIRETIVETTGKKRVGQQKQKKNKKWYSEEEKFVWLETIFRMCYGRWTYYKLELDSEEESEHAPF